MNMSDTIKHNRRDFLKASGFAAASLMSGRSGVVHAALDGKADSNNNKSPNIVLVMVDDVGYSDIGSFAAHINNTSTDKLYYETPRIDEFAKQGTMFTQFYVCSVCAPTRASLLTGKMNNRMGMWDAYAGVRTTYERTGEPVPPGGHILDNRPWLEYSGPEYNQTTRGVSIPDAATALHDVKTIPQGLEGYLSAFIGKWHLGSHNHVGYRSKDKGFDEVLAYYDGGCSGYYKWPFGQYAGSKNTWDDPGPQLKPVQNYVSDDVAQRACNFLTDRSMNHPDEPFFLYVAHPAPHTPIHPRADDLKYFKAKTKNKGFLGHANPEYAALLFGMDRSIGAILDKIDELAMADNTVVVFLSDNGGHPGFTRATPLRGGKSMLYEGGVRVPLIIRWPSVTSPSSKCDIPTDVSDMYPTLMDIAGVDYSDYQADSTVDGQSINPLFGDLNNAKKRYTRDEFYQFYGKMGITGYHNFATWATLRKGDYKLHYDYHGKVELYNIAEDIGEKKDLTDSNPGLAYDMLIQLTDWLKASCNESYLPKPNPKFNPDGPLPFGPYVPFEELKSSLEKGKG
jgi:arylsulfatase A-like enzyme